MIGRSWLLLAGLALAPLAFAQQFPQAITCGVPVDASVTPPAFTVKPWHA